MSERRVVVTGIGAVTPLGVGARISYDRWLAGESGLEDGEGRADDFDPTDFLSKKDARRTDRFAQVTIAAAKEALEQTGFEDDEDPPVNPERVGCIIATGIGGILTLEKNANLLRDKGPKGVSALAVPMLMPNAAAGNLAMRYGLLGPSHSVASACAAGADAIGTAMRLIQAGDADMVVAGGAEAALGSLAQAAFDNMHAISPSGISRPFDARRDGFIMGEGAGVLVLEEAESAAARDAEVLGEMLGFGASSDAHHITAPDPSGDGATRAIKRALEDAGMTPEDLDYVNAHGTSTQLNDRSETEALMRALGDRAKQLPVSSTKSVIGHMLGAAGAVEAILTLIALKERMAPPTVGWEERDEGMDLDYVPEARPLEDVNGDSAVAISNGFGFGGHNAVLCLRA
jgi:3-oxoacyl-[acyl-carrier-protein] synthase II